MLYPLDSVVLKKPQILSVLNEVYVCYKTQTQFSALWFLINKEKKNHLNIDEDNKITVCTCWQQSINNTKKERPSFSFYYIIKLKIK